MEKLNLKMPKKTWTIILLLFVMIGISNVEKAMIGYASIPIMNELDLSPTEWGLIGSAFYWFFAVSAIFGGTLADKIGTKHVITIMVALWAAVQFSTLFVYSLPLLILTRVILGIGEGPSYALAMTAASKWLPKEKTGTGLAIVSIGSPFFLAISSPLLIFLIAEFGWRSEFLAAGIVTVIWLALWIIFGKEKPDTEEKTKIIKENADSKVRFMRYLFSKNFIIVVISGFTAYWSMSVFQSWVPNYLATVLELGNAGISLAVTVQALLIMVSQLIFSTLSDLLYRKTKNIIKSRAFVMGPVVFIGGLSYFLVSLFTNPTLSIIFLSLGLTMGSVILVLGPALIVEIIHPQHHGKAQGIFVAAGSVGGMVGPYITGVLIESASNMSGGFHYGFYLMAAILAICGLLVWTGIRPKKRMLL